jgi:hypothetical protein
MVAARPEVESSRPTASDADQAVDADGRAVHRLVMRIVSQAEAIAAHAREYLTVRKDEAAAAARSLLLKAMLGTVAAVAGLVALATSIVQLLVGTAAGLAILFGDRLWLGQMVVGLGVLTIFVSATWIGFRLRTINARKEIARKYERQHVRVPSTARPD